MILTQKIREIHNNTLEIQREKVENKYEMHGARGHIGPGANRVLPCTS